jgi:hypothetical protein
MLLPSRSIIVLMLLPMACFFYLAWEKETSWAAYAIPFFVIAAAAFSLAPQIDWWWYQRNPPDVEPIIQQIFQTQLPFYQQLDADNKLKFRQRTALTMLATDYIVPSQDDDKKVPEDLKALIAAHAVMITWHKEKYIMDSFEKVVVYARSFPSPNYPTLLHTAESNEEDGVLLFSTERMLQALMEPAIVFNPVLYEYAKVFHFHFKLPSKALAQDIWTTIAQIGNIDKTTIEEHLGLPEPSVEAILMSYTILFPEKFKNVAPKLYEDFKKIMLD